MSRRFFVTVMAAAVVSLVAIDSSLAQFAVGGVYIDTEGMLRDVATLDASERLRILKDEAADAVPGDVRSRSALRKVSLKRLEESVRGVRVEGQPVPGEMRFLAGLTRVQYVFFYPDAGDVVLAGPAEGWTQRPTGEVVGASSQRPVVQLDDLIVALRYAFDPEPESGFVGCSIEPTADGMQKYAAYMNTLGGRMDRSRLPQIFGGMEQAMGPQSVKVYGVAGSTRLAMKMVSADYRLKRLALAHDPSPVPEMANYLDLQAKRLQNTSGAQKQHRWWFVAKYDALHHTADNTAFEFEGQGVAVMTAPTVIAKPAGKGSGKAAEKPAQASPAAQQFAVGATKQFPALAEKVPVFAELQNVIALLAAAELVHQNAEGTAPVAAQEATDEADKRPTAKKSDAWRPTHFLDAKACPVAEVPVPERVPSLANYRLVNDRHWLISVSGGVEIRPRNFLSADVRKESPKRKLGEARTQHKAPAGERWWWD